jgi:peptide subunit release factor 1 (eRF1)
VEGTLLALQEGRVWELVFADGFEVAGAQCTNCEAQLANRDQSCVYCGKAVLPVGDLVQTAFERVMSVDGKVEEVTGPAAQRLNKVGGVGAILHY